MNNIDKHIYSESYQSSDIIAIYIISCHMESTNKDNFKVTYSKPSQGIGLDNYVREIK
ncbi:hypothetical protein K5X82_02735 [Halosquirtibacter xylanolyticus]|uniref:hypothetical protein n=1 Tax=Halosquirtibacter xylanolyticus TaxID=3374599 RepID=UPI003748C12E|nr:hypothetical protein K5X82_02735 [Prolixibacteraceae bacterium]